MHAVQAQVLVEMQRDLAVRACAQVMPVTLQFLLDRLVTVELAVDDDLRLFVFTGDWLITGRQVDDAQPRMAEGHPSVGGYPVALSVGPATVETSGGAFDRGRRNRSIRRKDGNNAAHGGQRISGLKARGSGLRVVA